MYGLDFGLEALLFFGCALDGAGLLCVRLCVRVRANVSVSVSVKVVVC